MTGFILALLGVALAGIGARDQLLIAALSARAGRRPLALAVALMTTFAATAAATWASATLAQTFPGPARVLIAALAFAMAGGELLLTRAPKLPTEPTASLGALALVLLAFELTDASRFIIFALAAATRAPLSAGLGGALGAAVVLGLGWQLGGDLARPGLAWLRRGLGLALLVPAVLTGLHALGKI